MCVFWLCALFRHTNTQSKQSVCFWSSKHLWSCFTEESVQTSRHVFTPLLQEEDGGGCWTPEHQAAVSGVVSVLLSACVSAVALEARCVSGCVIVSHAKCWLLCRYFLLPDLGEACRLPVWFGWPVKRRARVLGVPVAAATHLYRHSCGTRTPVSCCKKSSLLSWTPGSREVLFVSYFCSKCFNPFHL